MRQPIVLRVLSDHLLVSFNMRQLVRLLEERKLLAIGGKGVHVGIV
jgi:hypothetical protein